MASRWLVAEGLVNGRDLGGLPTRGRGRVRSGLLFRTAHTEALTVRGASSLVDQHGWRTFVDLRSPEECRRQPFSPALVSRGVRVVPAPIDEGPSRLPRRPEPDDYYESYLHMLPLAIEPARVIVELVADGLFPLAFGCTAGKDRTGVVAALILGLLGVRPRDAARDYALTARGLRGAVSFFAPQMARAGLLPIELERRCATRAETMLRLWPHLPIATLERTVRPGALATFRENLLETPRARQCKGDAG
jgi:hypothetical protein